jgi:cyclopropane-fatty-acyl-phospholipid synthase
MNLTKQKAIEWTELGGLVPDPVIRGGIRRLLRQRLAEIKADDAEAIADELNRFVARMDDAEIAPVPELANEQHYEIPAAFYTHVLGERRKYSSCFWPEGVDSLDDAEVYALGMTCDRAELVDGQDILELGCGWGSLTLWMAERYPSSRITAVSNSASQGDYIRSEAAARGFDNITVLTRDMNDFDTDRRFDRIVSVEMFEHMRNYRALFGNVASWLWPGGKFFMHIFCHRAAAYEFVDRGPGDWMSRHFFSGGIMPSMDLPLRFQDDLSIDSQWCWSGTHYEKTANAWLQNMDGNRDRVMPILEATYGAENAQRWWMRWRIFFMACAELFGYSSGQAWLVGHYLFRKSR